MKISAVVQLLEKLAPPSLQEQYDNAGLITGNSAAECTGIIVCLDATEEVINEAAAKNCNLVLAHHPIVFGGLKKITGRTYVERAVIAAIRHDIAVYAIHTNLDNVIDGVNGRIADMLGLVNRAILQPKKNLLKKLVFFVPENKAAAVRDALFEAGAGNIGNYSECSFNSPGQGTFKGAAGTDPFVGKPGERHTESELRIEVVFQSWLEKNVIAALLKSHPYEEVAYDVYALENALASTGSGLTGVLPEPMSETAFLRLLKDVFKLAVIRHTPLLNKTVKKVALCGGAGSFLTRTALASGADFYITGDVKYHEFFDAEGRMVIADIGHYESEQYSIDLIFEILKEKYPTFAVLKTQINTNPVGYFL